MTEPSTHHATRGASELRALAATGRRGRSRGCRRCSGFTGPFGGASRSGCGTCRTRVTSAGSRCLPLPRVASGRPGVLVSAATFKIHRSGWVLLPSPSAIGSKTLLETIVAWRMAIHSPLPIKQNYAHDAIVSSDSIGASYLSRQARLLEGARLESDSVRAC